MVTLWWLTLHLAAARPPAFCTSLAYGGLDIHHQRVALTVTNGGEAEVAGAPVAVSADALRGAEAEDLRVCEDDGTELLWDLRDADGRRIETGRVPVGARLIVPATVAAGGRQRLWVYWDNATAYRVPEFLAAGAEPANGGFEAGEDGPAEWTLDGSSEAHELSWQAAGGRTGRCIRSRVPAGAEASWTAARQLGRPAVAGAAYTITGWVRGANVVGSAGWYVHVATNENPQAVNLVERAGEGTFDWRPVTIRFVAPPGAQTFSFGTVLHGTGTAWFDDVTVETNAPAPRVSGVFGTPERWAPAVPAPPAAATMIPAVAYNPSDEPYRGLVSIPAGARRAVSGPVTAELGGDPGRPLAGAGDNWLTAVEIPARGALRVDAVLRPGVATAEAAALVDSPLNLAVNPSFEAGDAQPEAWPGGSEQAGEGARVTRQAGGRFGGASGRILVPREQAANWVGWRQRVPVEVGASYHLSVWVKVTEADGPVRIHGHLRDAGGELAGNSPYWSTGGSVSGTSDWTELTGMVTIPPGVAFFEIHLTANVHGTIEHDGVFFGRVLPARAGELVSTPRAGLSAWLESPLVKVARGRPAPTEAGRGELAASRGEREAVQLCLVADADRTATVTPSPPRMGAATLPAPTIERVGYVPCLEPGGYFESAAEPWQRRTSAGSGRTDGWRGWWPDYLAPSDGTVELDAGQVQPIWLTYTIPREAAPGEYRGRITVSSPGAADIEIPYSLRVWRFQQPETPTLGVIYDLRSGTGERAFGGQDEVERWWRFCAERRISVDRVMPDPSFRWQDGQVVMETTAFDRAAALFFDELKLSAAYWPPLFYACGWAHPPGDFLGAAYPSADYDRRYGEAVRLFAAHLRQRGWFDRMSLYISDEPHFHDPERGDDVRRWLGHVIGLIRRVDPEIRVYSSTWQHEPAWDGLLNHWGIAQYGGFPPATMAERRAAGDALWFTTDGQMEIDTPTTACERLLPWYCAAHEVSGYEFWGLSWWTFDPYTFGWHSYIHQSSAPGVSSWVRYPNGDGYLAYPGRPFGTAGPISTIRLEQAREGIEDYELLRALDDLPADADVAAPRTRLRELAFIPNAGGYRSSEILPDPDALMALRREVGELLDARAR